MRKRLGPPKRNQHPKINPRSPFYTREGGQKFIDTFGNDIRNGVLHILKRGEAEDLWDLILECIDLGFAHRNDLGSKKIRASFLFSGSKELNSVLLDTKEARDFIRHSILPVARANRAEILAHPEQFDEIIRRHRREKVLANQKNLLANKSITLPEGEVIVKAYSTLLWPTIDGAYTYDQLCTACWYFRNLSGMLHSGTVADTALNVRLSIKWFSEYALFRDKNPALAKICQIIRHLSLLWESDPKGECAWPPFPLQEGRW